MQTGTVFKGLGSPKQPLHSWGQRTETSKRLPLLSAPVPPDLAPDHRPLLDEGIRIFNEGRHWHAHEAWEELWMDQQGDDREFIQGLIMAAALLVHYERGNPKGVANHWRNVQQRLPRHAPQKWGIDVQGLLDQLKPFVEDAAADRPLERDVASVQIRQQAAK